jgi:hypothetical protein
VVPVLLHVSSSKWPNRDVVPVLQHVSSSKWPNRDVVPVLLHVSSSKWPNRDVVPVLLHVSSSTLLKEFGYIFCQVVRVPGYRSRGPGSIPGATRLSEK